MDVGDIIRYRDVQTYLGVTCENVYYYRCSHFAGTPDLEDNLDGVFLAYVMGYIEAIQSVGVVHTTLWYDNLTNTAEYFSWDWSSEIGLITGEMLPAYVALSFMLRRTTKTTRNGSKRYVGLVEPWVEDGTFVGTTAAIETVQDALGADIIHDVGGDEYTLNPVIIGRDPDTGELELGNWNPIRNGVFRGVSSQNSRKRLYGFGTAG